MQKILHGIVKNKNKSHDCGIFFYFFINVFAMVMDSAVISAPLIIRATSLIRSSSDILYTDVVVLSSVTDFEILK